MKRKPKAKRRPSRFSKIAVKFTKEEAVRLRQDALSRGLTLDEYIEMVILKNVLADAGATSTMKAEFLAGASQKVVEQVIGKTLRICITADDKGPIDGEHMGVVGTMLASMSGSNFDIETLTNKLRTCERPARASWLTDA